MVEPALLVGAVVVLLLSEPLLELAAGVFEDSLLEDSVLEDSEDVLDSVLAAAGLSNAVADERLSVL